jgi:RsiW-degrading membrane proteinase PrsW (M82 family)
MDVKFYLKNIVWGAIIVAMVFYDWDKNPEDKKNSFMLIFSFFSCILCPLSIKMVEIIALKFSKKEFWQNDFFTSSVGGSLQAIFYLFCFVFSIPLGLLFAIYKTVTTLSSKG